MKSIKKLVALTTVMALFAGQVQGQERNGTVDGTVVADSEAYYDSGAASYWSAVVPVGVLVAAAVIIATTGRNHHHHSSSSSSSSSRSSSRICHQ